mgnify:CR=1 FL=1
MIKGNLDIAHQIGSHVYQLSLEQSKESEQDYWTQATLGEVLLILGKPEQAREYYSSAGEIGKRNFGKVSVISGLNEGDIIVAEGLKKVRPKGKIKPINK